MFLPVKVYHQLHGFSSVDLEVFPLALIQKVLGQFSVELISMSLSYGKSHEYMEKSHTGRGKTCKHHTAGPQVGWQFWLALELLLWGDHANHHAALCPNSPVQNAQMEVDK